MKSSLFSSSLPSTTGTWSMITGRRDVGRRIGTSGVLGREMACECLGIAPPHHHCYLSVGALRLHLPSTAHLFMWVLGIQIQDLILAWQVFYPRSLLPRQDQNRNLDSSAWLQGKWRPGVGSSCLSETTTKKAHGMVPNISAFKTQSWNSKESFYWHSCVHL